MPEGNRPSVNWRNVAIALAVVLICMSVAVYAIRYKKPYPKRSSTTLVKTKPIQKPAKAKVYRKNPRSKKQCECDTMIILIQ